MIKKFIPLILVLCLCVGCGAANTRYVENNSDKATKIEVKPVSYSVFWTEGIAGITKKTNNLLSQLVKIKDKVEIIEEHEKMIPELIQQVQDFIDDLSELNLSSEDSVKNEKRIEELRNLKIELENYNNILVDPNITTDDMQNSIDTIRSKVAIANE